MCNPIQSSEIVHRDADAVIPTPTRAGGRTGDLHGENLQCRQWRKRLQNDNPTVSTICFSYYSLYYQSLFLYIGKYRKYMCLGSLLWPKGWSIMMMSHICANASISMLDYANARNNGRSFTCLVLYVNHVSKRGPGNKMVSIFGFLCACHIINDVTTCALCTVLCS